MSKQVRDYLRRHHVGLISLFLVVTGGTAYATHPGGANTISTDDIINGQVQTQDIGTAQVMNSDIAPSSVPSSKIVDDAVQSADLAAGSVGTSEAVNNGLTGTDIAEGTLNVDANLLDGSDSSEFAPANPFATVDVDDGGPVTEVLALPDLGALTILFCDAADPGRDLGFEWRNTSDTDQDLWWEVVDTDDQDEPPDYSDIAPGAAATFNLANSSTQTALFRVQPMKSEGLAATIQMYATNTAAPDTCRVSAQAVLSR